MTGEYKLTRLQVNPQADSLIAAYGPLTPEPLHCCLRGQNPLNIFDISVIAIGATFQGKPIGIALATNATHLRTTEVLHLFVQPEHRNKHVGRELLAKVQEEARKERANIFSLVYSLGEPTTPALEKVIAANHWKGVRPFMLRCWYDVIAFDIPWVMQNTFQYPPGYEEFSWNQLTNDEKEELKHRELQRHFRSFISPHRDEALLEPLNSLGLRYQGKIVGWMLTHRIAPDTIRYSSIYVDRHLKHHGLIMVKLLVDSIHLHLSDRIHQPKALLEIPLLQVSSAWKHFIERRLLPYANKVEKLMQAWDIG